MIGETDSRGQQCEPHLRCVTFANSAVLAPKRGKWRCDAKHTLAALERVEQHERDPGHGRTLSAPKRHGAAVDAETTPFYVEAQEGTRTQRW